MAMNRLLLVLVAALFMGSFVACSSSPTSGSGGVNLDESTTNGESTRVSFRDYRTAQRLTLINDAFLVHGGVEGDTPKMRAAAFYSNWNKDLNVKVISNALMEGMLEYFDDKGFSSNAQSGKAPPSHISNPDLSTSLEVVVAKRPFHWRFSPQWRLPLPRIAERYHEAKDVFLNIHRDVTGWQAASADDWNLDGVKIKRGEWR